MNARLLAFLAVLTVLRLVYIGRVELSPDEAQYYQWSQRLDWCYFSKGPGVALTIRLGTALFGPSEFGVRFFAPVLALGTSLLLYALARRIFDSRVATWTVVLANVTPIFNAGGLIMTIDPLSIFFWTAALYTLWRAFEAHQEAGADEGTEESGPTRWWLASGFLIGCGFLCKWTNAMQLLSILLLVLLTKRCRSAMKSPGFWGMFAVFALFVVPVVIWNEKHGWPTTHHLAARGGLDTPWWRLDLKAIGKFIASHFGAYSPLLFAGMLLVLWEASRDSGGRWARALRTCGRAIPRGLRRHVLAVVVFSLLALAAYFAGNYFDSNLLRIAAAVILILGALTGLAWHREVANIHWRSRFLVAFALPVILMNIWIALHHDAEVNWTAPAAVSLLVLLAQFVDRLWNADRRPLVGLSVALSAVMSLVTVNTDIVRAAGIRWPIERDLTARLRGWQATANAVQKFRHEFEAQTGQRVFLIAENYGVASALSYYLPEKRIEIPGHPPVYVEESPVPTSQYHFWGRYDEYEARTAPVLNAQDDSQEYGINRFAGRSALYITTRDEGRPPSVLKRTFERWEIARDYVINEGTEPLRRVRIFICHRYRAGVLLD
jgi:4-amino-4-deoxy-L-arabinose transferase-like glycosyltransferase